MPYALTPQEIGLRLGIAAACGFLIGIDRELKRKNLGVRVFLLVCLGSAGFTLILIEITNFYHTNFKDLSMDPTRIISGIVTGIGFLGGGAFLQNKGRITGAATGASIWVSGGVGVACGFGFYWHAGLITAYAVIVLAIIGHFRAKYRKDMKNDTKDAPNKGENSS
jgi:putative Mg2+ transporter-C (MgtC) family protein